MIQSDQIRFISSILACIPLSYIIPKIPNVYARELYSFLMGTIIQYYIYGSDIYLVFLLHFLVYGMVKISPANCGKSVTIVTLLLLFLYHIYRMMIDYGGWTLDVSTIMMSNVNKYSYFAYAVQDGKARLDKLTKQQIKEKVDKIPPIYRFIGYCQFLPCSPIGTAFPYKYYEDYIQLKNQYAKIPSPWKAIGRDYAIAGFMLLVYVIHVFVFPLSTLQSKQFTEKGFWYILFFSYFCVTVLRSKYYFGWKLSMGPIHSSGISYQINPDNTSDFKLIQNCNPQIVQATPQVRDKITNWNMSCQQWLRKCIYQRTEFKNKFYSQLVTFLVSSFWHGLYGGYYITFFLWFWHMYISQLIYKESKRQNSPWVKYYNKSGIVGKVIVWITSNMAFSVSGASFQILSVKQSFAVLKAIYFVPFIAYFIVNILFTFGATKQKRVKDPNQKQILKENQQKTSSNQPVKTQ